LRFAQAAPAGSAPDAAKSSGGADRDGATFKLGGFYQGTFAYTYSDPVHWSRMVQRFQATAEGNLGEHVKYKLGGRVDVDPLYYWSNFYLDDVKKDQRFSAIWGEVVGLFFADVVSARDTRDFLLPSFDIIRIPQWAARAEYFSGDFHAEAVWIPYMTYDDIGKPGAEFYPFNPPPVPGFQTVIAKEDKPTGIDDSAYGARLSWLQGGWDVSGFYYTANDPSAAFSRQTSPVIITYQPIHDRIHQLGATLGKDLGPMVLKAEAVYTRDKLFTTTDPLDADSLVRQDFLDYIVGLEWSFPQETRFNVQLFQRWFPDHDAGILPDETESGVSLLLSTQALHPRLEPEVFLIRSLNRNDWLAQFKLTWKLDGNWRLAAGVDIFDGPAEGLFGAFDDRDRVYTEVRYSF
jgi:hypothetical protein